MANLLLHVVEADYACSSSQYFNEERTPRLHHRPSTSTLDNCLIYETFDTDISAVVKLNLVLIVYFRLQVYFIFVTYSLLIYNFISASGDGHHIKHIYCWMGQGIVYSI